MHAVYPPHLFWRCKSCVSALHQHSETKLVVILIQASILELARWLLLLWSPVQGCGYRAWTHPLWVWGSWGHCFHAGLRASPFLCSYLSTALASGAVPWRQCTDIFPSSFKKMQHLNLFIGKGCNGKVGRIWRIPALTASLLELQTQVFGERQNLTAAVLLTLVSAVCVSVYKTPLRCPG